MIKTFRYRCYPNKGTRRRLWRAMRSGITPVWNACIREREQVRKDYRERRDEAICDWVREHKVDIPLKEEEKIRREVARQMDWPDNRSQYKHCRQRDHPEFISFSSKMLECTVGQVHWAEKSFRALWLKGDKDARPPKQQGIHRCLMFRSSGYRPRNSEAINVMEVPAVALKGIGRIKLRLHRPLEGQVKAVAVTEKNGRWYAGFCCEAETFGRSFHPGEQREIGFRANKPKNNTRDIGTNNGSTVVITFAFAGGVFLTDSDGLEIPFPQFYWSEIERLRRLSRSRSRKQPARPGKREDKSYRGRNLRKANRMLARWHERVARKRDYFLWHVALYYASRYQTVTVPQWPLKHEIHYAVTSKKAMKLCDAAYGTLIEKLRHKCREYGTELIVRKDEQWEREMQKLNEVARLEKTKVLGRRLRRALRNNDLAVLPSLRAAFEQAATWRTSSPRSSAIH